jgi:phage shock protein C
MKRLGRSRENRILGGVCAGLAEYMGLHPNLVRMFFVLLALGDGIGFLLYFILWIVIPEGEPGAAGRARAQNAAHGVRNRTRALGRDIRQGPVHSGLANWIGIGLVLYGGFVLLRTMGVPWLWWLDSDVLWPLLLVIGGLVVLFRGGRDSGG